MSNNKKTAADDSFLFGDLDSGIEALPHLNTATHESNSIQSEQMKGVKLRPFTCRLTNPYQRAPKMAAFVNKAGAMTKRKVTEGKLLSALIDCQDYILQDPVLSKKLIDAIRDL
ncbi:hypothetical protein ACTFQF_00395 [Aliivibrio fischeri]|uniref:Uncharacterized protein n=1 Tax=Aliivibrio fischeri (strain MJ11) TaxID=388396 RepID=B5EVY0_ALIFM|nr:hypothetical protein [Aliivibrio fischeri]ACH64732.1 hypothetical protein VFMJ11_B0037 [Aliivibrio fischeri MJ11]